MKNRILIFILTLSVTLGVVVAFAKTSKAYSQTEPIAELEIYGQSGFLQTYTFSNGISTIELNQYMKSVFNAGANASWDFTIYLTLYRDITLDDFYLLFNNIEGIKEVDFENESGDIVSFIDNISYVYDSQNLDIDSVKYVYFVASGTSLLDVVVNVANNGYNQGFADGYNKGFSKGEDKGFNEGYTKGEDKGFNDGFDKGYKECAGSQNSLYDMVLGVVDTPFRVFNHIFDFDVLGINIKNIVLSFATIAIAIFVIKRFI